MNTIIILLGPTGVGKTDTSVLLAQELATEIISADSMQIYRGMDIGTAKPTKETRTVVKHHMIDIVDPSDSYSTGEYIDAVVPIIKGMHRAGKIPLVVGGTGLYIKALTRGIFRGPSADWTLRNELLAMEREEKGSLYSCLVSLDPDAAVTINHNDTRRVVRALEVCLKSREKMSRLQERLTRRLPFEFIKIGLLRDRRELYGIIEERVDRMIATGLVEEVARLREKKPDRTPLQAIGYKELAHYLNGSISRDEAVGRIKRNSRRYAKRQFTWFRKEEGIHWIDVTGVFDSRRIKNAVKEVIVNYLPDIVLPRRDGLYTSL